MLRLKIIFVYFTCFFFFVSYEEEKINNIKCTFSFLFLSLSYIEIRLLQSADLHAPVTHSWNTVLRSSVRVFYIANKNAIFHRRATCFEIPLSTWLESNGYSSWVQALFLGPLACRYHWSQMVNSEKIYIPSRNIFYILVFLKVHKFLWKQLIFMKQALQPPEFCWLECKLIFIIKQNSIFQYFLFVCYYNKL